MSRIFETERFKTGYNAYALDREMAQAMFRNNIRDWVLPNCVSRELFDKVHAENERLKEMLGDLCDEVHALAWDKDLPLPVMYGAARKLSKTSSTH